MAGTNTVNNLQLGDSPIATRNFVWQTNNDGSAKLARGNVGATTQDILTVDQNGRVAFPQSVVAFRVYAASTVTALSTTDAKINFDTKSDVNGLAFDTDNSFNLATDGFQPKVAGYYALSAMISGSNGTSQLIASFRKNNNIFAISTQVGTAARIAIADLIYLNGTTDYVELFGFSSPGQNTIVGTATYFAGHLVAKA